MGWFNDALFTGVGTQGITKVIITEEMDMDDANNIEADFKRCLNESMKAQEKGKEPVSDCVPSNMTWVLTWYCQEHHLGNGAIPSIQEPPIEVIATLTSAPNSTHSPDDNTEH